MVTGFHYLQLFLKEALLESFALTMYSLVILCELLKLLVFFFKLLMENSTSAHADKRVIKDVPTSVTLTALLEVLLLISLAIKVKE